MNKRSEAGSAVCPLRHRLKLWQEPRRGACSRRRGRFLSDGTNLSRQNFSYSDLALPPIGHDHALGEDGDYELARTSPHGLAATESNLTERLTHLKSSATLP
jgi:hypothetical protein